MTGSTLPRTGDVDRRHRRRAGRALDDGVLAVQGPPGTGKTYVGSHVIAALARRGWRIGVTAQGHKTVENLLERVVELGVPGGQGAAQGRTWRPHVVPWQTPKTLAAWMGEQLGGYVVGGTAWTFARPGRPRARPRSRGGRRGRPVQPARRRRHRLGGSPAAAARRPPAAAAGQPGRAPGARRRLRAGPPPRRARPDPARARVPASTSPGRMHPAVCAPVSALQYEGQLHSHPDCARRHLAGVAPGVTLVPVEHRDNRTQSREEVTAVLRLVDDVLGRPWTDVDSTRPNRSTPTGVLVVAPFNRQVQALRRGVGRGRAHQASRWAPSTGSRAGRPPSSSSA